MIKRETYMNRIRPFIDKDLIKIMTGFRRSGKSVMLELIKNELLERGCKKEQFISFNFEKMGLEYLCSAKALHDEVIKLSQKIDGKVYLFFDEIQEVNGWEKCVNSFRVELDCDIYITGSNAKLLSGELATYLTGRYIQIHILQHILADAMLNLLFIRFLSANFRSFTARFSPTLPKASSLTNTLYRAVCHISATLIMNPNQAVFILRTCTIPLY